MTKPLLPLLFFFFWVSSAHAQLGAMKLVGKDTKDYSFGFGAFIKSGLPVSDGSTVTLEVDADVFFLNDGYENSDGTFMCPLKVGYRYSLNKSGSGWYVEPQAGFNLVGLSWVSDKNGEQQELKYHGAVLAAGTGYLFTAWHAPFDVNLRYETVIAHGGSNNLISLGISRFISFRRRD